MSHYRREINTGLLSNSKNELEISTPEEVIATKDANPIHVEVSQKGKDNSSVIANEIIGNLKMAGIAAALFAIYMIGFMLIHQKDIKKYDYDTHTSYFGESCYDPATLMGNWKFHWEQHYYDKLYFALHQSIPIDLQQPTPEECLKDAQKLEEEYNQRVSALETFIKYSPKQEGVATEYNLKLMLLKLSSPDVLKEEAKDAAKRDIGDWNDTINNHRRWGYEEDLKNNAIYAAIICLLVMILGRYLVKSIKWVNANKTT